MRQQEMPRLVKMGVYIFNQQRESFTKICRDFCGCGKKNCKAIIERVGETGLQPNEEDFSGGTL